MSGVVALSATDAWAVGYAVRHSNLATLTEHWDGEAWSIIPTPNLPTSAFAGVSASSATDVWAVGYRGYGKSATLTEHWNGRLWTVVKSGNVTGDANFFSGVTAVPGTTEYWAVGGTAIPPSGNDVPLTERYSCKAFDDDLLLRPFQPLPPVQSKPPMRIHSSSG